MQVKLAGLSFWNPMTKILCARGVHSPPAAAIIPTLEWSKVHLHHHGLQLSCDHLALGAGVMTILSFWPGTASTAKAYHQVKIALELLAWIDTDPA